MTRPYNTRASAQVRMALRVYSSSPRIASAAGVSLRVARGILLKLCKTGLATRIYIDKVHGYRYMPRQPENKH